MDSQQRRQTTLFILAVLLPAALLVVLGLRLIRQESELAETRQVEERQRLARDLGEQLLVRLEGLMLEVIRADGVGVGSSGAGNSGADLERADPAIVLVGRIDDERLVLPWETDEGSSAFERLVAETGFKRTIQRAEREEFVEKDFGRAVTLYRAAFDDADNTTQRAYARLLLARVLAKDGRDREAVRTPKSLSPTALYMLHGLAASLAENAPGANLGESANELVRAIDLRTGDVDQILALQADFSALVRAPNGRLLPTQAGETAGGGGRTWILYGHDPWLVGVASSLVPERLLVLVVRSAIVWTALTSENGLYATVGEPQLRAGQPDVGEALDRRLPGLRVTFTTVQDAAAPASAQPLAAGHLEAIDSSSSVPVVASKPLGASTCTTRGAEKRPSPGPPTRAAWGSHRSAATERPSLGRPRRVLARPGNGDRQDSGGDVARFPIGLTPCARPSRLSA